MKAFGFLIFCLAITAQADRYPAVFLKGDDQGRTGQVRLSELAIDVEIAGNLASTEMTLVFQNEENRILEGRLIFPMNPGQTLSRFAMDVNGRLREGVYVEKAWGRNVFETLVRRVIDPGLLEWIDGEQFSARVYPIPANGTKTIVIRYEEELKRGEGGEALFYDLPLRFPKKFDQYSVTVRGVTTEAPVLINRSFGKLQFEEELGGFVANRVENQATAKQSLQLKISVPEEPIVFVTEDAEANERFVYAFMKSNREPRPRPLARKIGVLWDTSASSSRRQTIDEKQLLKLHLAKLGDAEVTVIPFGHKLGKKRTFSVKDGNSDQVINYLSSFMFDGATRYGSLDLSSYDCDAFLMFSDGLGTYGSGLIRHGDKPVLAINSVANNWRGEASLQRLAANSGGALIDLSDKNVKRALSNLVEERWRFIGLSDFTEKSGEFYPRSLEKAGDVSVAAKLDAKAETITAQFGFENDVTEQVEISLLKNVYQSPLAKRMWVRKKFQSLDANRDQNREAIIDLAHDYAIVTPFTSLIVLDRMEDYVRFGVKPPMNEPGLYEKWLSRGGQERGLRHMTNSRMIQPKGEGKAKEQPMRYEVVSSFNKRKAFHEKANFFNWLDDTNLSLTKNGMDYLRMKVKGSPAEELYRRDLESITYLYGRADVLARSFVDIQGRELSAEEEAAKKAWLGKSLQLQREINPLKLRYQDEYIAYQAKQRKVAEARERLLNDYRERQFSRSRTWGGASDGFADPFADPFSTGGGEGSSRPAAPPVNVKKPDDPARPDDGSVEFDPSFGVNSWASTASYITMLKSAQNDEKLKQVYQLLRLKYSRNPLFFIDVADFLRARGDREFAIQVLSNVAEMRVDDPQLLRKVAYRLRWYGDDEQAHELFVAISGMQPDDPTSIRDLGLSNVAVGNIQQGADFLWEVVRRDWDRVFGNIHEVALADLSALIANPPGNVKLDTSRYFDDVTQNLDADLRIVLSWDADEMDVDLFVYDPGNSVPRPQDEITKNGGRLTNDVTVGYGPEEFVVTRAIPGTYSIRAKRQHHTVEQRRTGPITVYVEVTKNFGRPNAETRRYARRLNQVDSIVEVTTFTHSVE